MNNKVQIHSHVDRQRARKLKLLTWTLMASCSIALSTLSLASTEANCDFQTVVFDAKFDGGRLDGCTLHEASEADHTSALHFELLVNPENTPINPSPWYAFSVASKGPEQTVSISIVADNAKPRYVPKMSVDKKHWQAIDFSIDDGALHFKLALSNTPVFIAAQELIVASDYQNWMQQDAIKAVFSQEQVGTSVEKRPIHGLIAAKADNKEWLLIIGRQHPPEITGALALFAFVDKLAEKSELQQAFLQRFNVLVVPMINPDGVISGNWRHNTNGIDLNRDWGKFTQPETLSTFKYFDKRMELDHRLVFALDFHSTQQDIFYTMPTDYGLVPADFTERWLEQLKQQRLGSFTVRARPGSSPGRGVFKQFIADHYGVHSVTYEMGDNTQRNLIKHIAHTNAKIMMQQMLDTPTEAFIPEPANATDD